MNLRALLSAIGLTRSELARVDTKSPRPGGIFSSLTGGEPDQSGEPWYDRQTALRKHRRHRSARMAMARASRRTNR